MQNSPADELVDILDDQGHPVGVATRRDMRLRRLTHRCVYLLVFNTRGELFIHQRTSCKDVFPSYWDVAVGGVLAAGESFAEGVRREAREEIGVAVDPTLLFPFRYQDERTSVFAEVYRATHDGPFRFQPEEVCRGEFVTAAEFERRVVRDQFCPDGLQVWAQYSERNRRERVEF